MIALQAFATRQSFIDAAVERILKAVDDGMRKRGKAFAALSGGSTPEPVYAQLATLPLNWSNVTFLLVDERFVSPADDASNEAMLRRALAPALAAGAQLLPMYSDASLEQAAHRADALYADRPIDIAIMGMGADGHTASWFPQSSELQSALDMGNRSTVIAVRAPGAAGSSERLTLTRSALARAGAIQLLITGVEKRSVLENAQRAPLPVDALFELTPAADVLWSP